MKSFHLTVSMPDGNVFDDDILEVNTRGTEGCFSILAGHIPFITAVVEGDFTITGKDEEEKVYKTNGGLLTVSKEKVTFLTSKFDFE